MQGVHSIGGGRFFDSGCRNTGGDRRLMPHPPQKREPIKCPRCESLNTKFCYYNNYNLSQPRHFCKNCRRYWTNGGVLRNVPVGGGCRKSKRSKARKSSSEHRASSPPTTMETPAPTSSQKKMKLNSHSSSESSSLTAANTASSSTEAMSATNHLVGMQESKFYMNNQSGMAQIETGLLEQGAESGIFSEIGSLTGLIPSTNEALSFGFGNISDMFPFRFGSQSYEHLGLNVSQHDQWQQQHKWMVGNSMGDHSTLSLKLPEISGGSSMLDQTVQVDFLSSLQGKTSNHASFRSLDWQCVGEQALFNLPNPVDQTYWSQSHWTEQDNPRLYLL